MGARDEEIVTREQADMEEKGGRGEERAERASAFSDFLPLSCAISCRDGHADRHHYVRIGHRLVHEDSSDHHAAIPLPLPLATFIRLESSNKTIDCHNKVFANKGQTSPLTRSSS